MINRDPDALGGWFVVAEVSTLFNGETQFSDDSANQTVTGYEYDIVGVQLIDEIALDPDTGYVAAPEPALVVTAAPETPPVAGDAPEPTPIEPAPVMPTGRGPEDELCVARQAEPTLESVRSPGPLPEPDYPILPDFSAAPEVDLAKVAAALASLDVGSDPPPARYELDTTPSAPAAVAVVSPVASPGLAPGEDPGPADGARRSTDPASVSWLRRSPDLPRVPMPEGAVPVYGDTLPDSPSYLNPVVVSEPDALPLPKRRSAS